MGLGGGADLGDGFEGGERLTGPSSWKRSVTMPAASSAMEYMDAIVVEQSAAKPK